MKRTTLVSKNAKIAPEPERLDLVVRGGKLVTPNGVIWADLGVRLGKIVQIEPEIKDLTHETIDAKGSYVFPGIIDAHVHFNEPGRADWEGLGSGSAALAAGGGGGGNSPSSSASAAASSAAILAAEPRRHCAANFVAVLSILGRAGAALVR